MSIDFTCSTVEAVVCRARRIGCSAKPAIHVRTHGMTAHTLADAPGSPAESNVDSALLAQLPVLRRAWDEQAVSAGFAEMIRTSNYS
jgi:hypothetical protein